MPSPVTSTVAHFTAVRMSGSIWSDAFFLTIAPQSGSPVVKDPALNETTMLVV